MKSINLIILSILMTVSIFAATNTNTKIKKSEKSLHKSKLEQKETSQQLDKIAKKIKKADKDNKSLNKKLEVLSQQFTQNKEVYKNSKKALSQYDQSLNKINQKIKENNQRFIETLANQSSVIHAMNQSHDPTRESIIMQEAYRLLKKQNSKELIQLNHKIKQKETEKKKIVKKRSTLKKKIDKMSKQRNEYKKQKTAKVKLLKNLSSNEDNYQRKLKKAMNKQDALRSTLADLNILQKKEVEEEKRIAAAQQAAMLAEAKRKKEERAKNEQARVKARKEGTKVVYKTKVEAIPTKQKVRDLGSSYEKNKIYAYRGSKTISPIKGAKVIKKFGTYIDPIYKIKIFNESITLKAPSRNAKVKNVLNGKVVFAGSSSMLGKVVVVSHSGKMHTVYAGLSKIAPNLKKGSKIKKGYVVGKVSSKLIFEATKNSKHINPLKLIRI